MEQVKKMVRVDENPMEIEKEVDGDESSENELSDMEKLPPEILMKILNYLTERQLVKCRLVNSRWNEISCMFLQDEAKNFPYSDLIVRIEKPFRKKKLECRTTITKSLDFFLKCFAPSEDEISSGRRRPCPFSTFNIQSLKCLNDTQMCEFISTFGPHIKIVTLGIYGKEDIPNFQNLWKLLLHCASNIESLGISGDSSLKDVQLVDPISKLIAKMNPNFKTINPTDTFLQNLKVLEITSHEFGKFNGFLKDLLDVAPNIQQIFSCDSFMRWNSELKHLEVLQELGKVHLIKGLHISANSRSDLTPAELMKNLRLKNLTANCGGSPNSVKSQKTAINYIYHAIKSSQETLSTLDLKNLTMESMNHCFKDISTLPNVRELWINTQDPTETGNILDRFSKLCPSVTILELDRLNGENLDVARILWTRFKNLKSLHLSLAVYNGDYDPLILDSAFTGYSLESIQRIQSKLEEGISMEEARGGETQNPSIFDLKGLAELQLRVDLNDAQWPESKEQVRNCLLMKILPEYLTKNPCLLKFSRRSVIDDHYINFDP